MDRAAIGSSHVLYTPAAPRDEAYAFFQRKLHYETDPSDVYRDMQQGVDTFVVLDVRSPEAYARSHVPAALHLPTPRSTPPPPPPYRTINSSLWIAGARGVIAAPRPPWS